MFHPATTELSNSVRQALLQMKMTCTARTLDGLRMRGIEPGMLFTLVQAVAMLKGLVGEASIRRALTETYELFAPPIDPLPPSAVPDRDLAGKNKNAFCLDRQSHQKPPTTEPGPKGGRPAYLYRMPSNAELCQILGVNGGYSAPLSLEDLMDPKQYRLTLHVEFIRRRPGRHALSFLASRVGVSKRTIQRYNAESTVESIPQWFEFPIWWQNLGILPDDLELAGGGVCLLIEGKHYPPLRQIAIKALGDKRTVTRLVQTTNYYYVGVCPRMDIYLGTSRENDLTEQAQAMANYTRKQRKNGARTRTGNRVGQSAYKPVQGKRPLRRPGAEAAATQVYEGVQNLSLQNARRLVHRYGQSLALQGLQVMTSRVERGKTIRNPAGFIHTWLRSTARGKGASD